MSLITPDFGLIFWMTLIFGIVLFILAKWGFPIITGMVDRRSERIEKSIAEAKEAEKKLQNLEKEQSALLQQARSEQARIIREASEARDRMLSQARDEARREADKIISEARTQIEAEKESALRDVRREVAVIGVAVAEKILSKELSADAAQKEYAQKCADELSHLS